MTKRFNYDSQSDSLYIHVKEGQEDSFEEIVPGISLELNDRGEVIGVEILKASRFSDRLKLSSTT